MYNSPRLLRERQKPLKADLVRKCCIKKKTDKMKNVIMPFHCALPVMRNILCMLTVLRWVLAESKSEHRRTLFYLLWNTHTMIIIDQEQTGSSKTWSSKLLLHQGKTNERFWPYKENIWLEGYPGSVITEWGLTHLCLPCEGVYVKMRGWPGFSHIF